MSAPSTTIVVVKVICKVEPSQVHEELWGWMSFDATKSKSVMKEGFIFGQINEAIITMKDIRRF